MQHLKALGDSLAESLTNSYHKSDVRTGPARATSKTVASDEVSVSLRIFLRWIAFQRVRPEEVSIPIEKGLEMAFVVTAPCFGCKYTDCVVVCPIDCFHEGELMLYISPEDCIDCDQCRAACPVEAIFHEDDVPEEWQAFIPLNSEMAAKTPLITEAKPPLTE